MADLVMGAVGSLIPKLGELLKEEYSLQPGVKVRISSLALELEGAQAALGEVAQVPWDQLDEQVQIWARHVREASYDMEDIIDAFLVRVEGTDSTEQEESLLKPLNKMANLFKKSKARRKINSQVQDIMASLQEVAKRRRRYKINDIVARPATTSTVDPRLHATYNNVKKLVGVDKSSDKLISMLQPPQRDDASSIKMKIVSIVGAGGLGKTTLVKMVFDKLKGDFDCAAFVPVGRNPDLKKVFMDILIHLDEQRYGQLNFAVLYGIAQLINELRGMLKNKRYFIAIDDIWEIQSWETIKLAIDDDNNCGGRILITTRTFEVATKANEVYKIPPLSYDSSRYLFLSRIYGHERQYVDNEPDEILFKILNKCEGIPSAIIAMASLLADKPRDEWYRVYESIGFGLRDNHEVETTRRIVSFSYYDLPPDLRTCLLYLCGFPENFVIKKENLIWKWIAEGFIAGRQGIRLFEIGEGYFNDLINRSMIQAVMTEGTGLVYGCRVGGMVYDLIRCLSLEENFVCVLDEEVEIFRPERRIRCLAIQNSNQERSLGDNNMELLKQLRSLTAIGCPMYMIPPVFSFILLRVLDLESCGSMEGYDHEHIGELLHLRFLGLRNTLIRKVPESIGRLRFLQTLELEGSGVEELPASMDKLASLMFLSADWTTRVPDWIEKLTCLQHLVMYPGCCGDDEYSARYFIKGLGNLKELRVLRFLIKADEGQQIDLLESLANLPMIEVIHFDFYGVQWERGVQFEPTGFALSKNLRFLELPWFEFPRLPSWINAQDLPHLCHLLLMLFDVDEHDLEKLGRFTELHHLHLLTVNNERRDAITCASGGFQNLRFCSITKPFKFLQGAMPRLEVLEFHLSVRLQSGADSDLDFDFGLGNLPSLRQVMVQINCLDAFPEKVEETEAALREAIHMHPNHPILEISISLQKLEKADNDGVNDISNSDNGKGVEVAKAHSNSVSYTKSLSLARDGIDEPMDEIIQILSVVDNEANNKKMKIVPIVRSEGRTLKTTLVQKVFDKLRPQFDCAAFVLVGQNPDMRKVLTDILVGLDKKKFQDFHMTILHIVELIGLVRKSLINKRFFVVVDDIWDLKAWDIINCALIGSSNGSAILTTSSNIDITIAIGGGQQFLPLSPTDSKKIFCKKLFGSENKCPLELENICDNLIKTCGGILSAIDETVTWLESIPPTVKEWQAVYQRRKLDLSYPKLPDHLKKSLLYFSMFPKGYKISAERLVWAWIAEDFVQGTQGPQDLQKVRKSYLSELIKENIIEAVEVDADGMALSCRAYDLVHDFIVSKSREENLVAILNDSQDRALSTTVDRLSIQGNHSQQKAWFSKVKSLVAACDNLPPMSGFTDLRVMDLEGCDSLQASHLKDMKKTNSLRYLAIGGKYIAGIPKDITKKLTDLQTLDLSASGLNELPKSVFSLRKLVCLRVSSHMKIPGGIEEMSALQELGDVNIVKPELLKRLRKLRKLRVLRIALWSWDEGFKSYVKLWWDTLLSLIGFFKNIESLCILTFCSLDFMDGSGDKWPPHQTLQKLEIRHSAFHDKLPSWFVSLSNISSLTIEVNKLSESIIFTLGKLSALCSLSLTSKEVPEVYSVIDSGTFKKLGSLKFVCSAMVEMFARPQSNETQQLTRLTIVFQASRTKDVNKDFRFGLDNLLSLEHVRVEINCFSASHQMVNDAEDAIRKELFRAGRGSSQPNLEIRRLEEESMIEEEDQTTCHQVARTSSLKTEGNGDESDSKDLFECTMKTMQAEPVVVGLAPMSSAEVVSKVLYRNSSTNTFLKNVGILASSMKTEKSTEGALWQECAASTILHLEVDVLKKKSEVTEQAVANNQIELANTQREFEEFKKQMEENNLLLKRILQLNNAGIS